MEGPFMERMWRNLLPEVLFKVVTFLPIASVCRFRTVSKKWNKLISHPDFTSIYARSSPPEDFVLIAVRFEFKPKSDKGWEVLDVAKKKFFNLSDDFLTEFVKKNNIVDFSGLYEVERTLLAADGGLFCFCYSMHDNKGSANSPSFVVCNPVLKTAKQLPSLETWGENYQRVVMSTDRLSMEYEIFIINNVDDMYEGREFYIYESKTATWRKAPYNGFPKLHTQFAERWWCPVSTFIKNEFYKLYTRCYDESQVYETKVLSYNKTTGVGSELDIRVDIDGDEFQLVVSNDRLFCVSENFEPSSINIFEIVLASYECIWFAEMPGELVHWLLQTGQDDDDSTNKDDSSKEDDTESSSITDTNSDDAREAFEAKAPVIATGCANAILICSWVGRSVVYSLSNRSWYCYPDNSLSKGEEGFNNNFQQLYGGSFCLSLCAS